MWLCSDGETAPKIQHNTHITNPPPPKVGQGLLVQDHTQRLTTFGRTPLEE